MEEKLIPVHNPVIAAYASKTDNSNNQGYNDKGLANSNTPNNNILLDLIRQAESGKLLNFHLERHTETEKQESPKTNPISNILTSQGVIQQNTTQHNLAALLNNVSATEVTKNVNKVNPPLISNPIVSPTINLLQMKSEDIKALFEKQQRDGKQYDEKQKNDEKGKEEDEPKQHSGRLIGRTQNKPPTKPQNSFASSQYPTNTHLGILNGPNVQPPPFKNEAEIGHTSDKKAEIKRNNDLIISLLPGKQDPMKDVDLSGLSQGQKAAIEAVLSGKNILLTGPAGTGKSHCIQKIRDIFTKKSLNVAMTSTTGASAILIDGNTIHSWSGIGICGSKDSALKRVLEYRAPQDRIKTTHLLIIDEVSMLSALILDILDYVARVVRQNDSPFGGLQVLLCGDIYQLSPVKAPTYAFESESFDKLIHEVHELTQIFRQDSEEFCTALNEIRIGEVSAKTKQIFSQCIGRKFEGDIKPTELYPLRADVEMMNQDELWKLANEQNMIRQIDALDEIVEKDDRRGNRKQQTEKFHQECKARLNKDCIAPEILQLCVGAQVMLIKNLDVEAGLANGSRGVCVGFDGQGAPIVKFRNGQVIYMYTQTWWMRINENTRVRRTQYPLILGWAITIHKSQGQTIDCLKVDLGSKVFCDSMIYTAISRARTIDGLSITAIDWNMVSINSKVKEFYIRHKRK